MKNLSLYMAFAVILISGSLMAQNQNCLSFDNIDDYVDVPNASGLIAMSQTISMTCWVYPENTNITFPDYDGFCGFRNNTDADFYMVQHAPTSVEARFRNSAGVASDVVFTNLQINAWQHFAFVYDGSMIRLYHNGAIVGNTPASGAILNGLSNFYIGDQLYSLVHYYMNGKLDEVSLWDKALTSEEILQIYNCAINPTASNLLLYYKFDQGTANGNNTSITSLTNSAAGSWDGTLHNFALNGTTSNFVDGVSTPVNQVNATICNGESYQFGTQLLTQPGVYTQSFPTSTGCDSIVELTLIVFTPNSAVTLSGITLTAQQGGATYKWLNCNTGFTVIPGATGQSYTATANGSYAVIVTMNNCSDTSNCVPVTTVDIPENNTIPGLQIYPNPVREQLFVDMAIRFQKANLRIFTSNGQELINASYQDAKSIRCDVAGLPSGVYFLHLIADDQQVNMKFTK